MKNLSIVVLLLMASFNLAAQINPLDSIVVRNGCNLIGQTMSGKYYFNMPSSEMASIFDELIAVAGNDGVYMRLVASANATNALATISNYGRRLIVYNNNFVENFKKESRTAWSARFLLAHEIGHHYLNHGFVGKSKEESHADELAADAFAATILARLGADANECVAGISTFLETQEENSETHPDPKARIDRVSIAWQNEMRKQTQVQTPAQNLQKKALSLDPSAFRNPWNIISEAKAVIDEEKVTFNFSLPSDYERKDYKVCVFANSEGVSPGKNPGSFSGTSLSNELTNLGEGKSSVWNYLNDRYDRSQVDKAKNIRFYVFDPDDLPSEPLASSATYGGIMGTGGIALSIWGISKISVGLDLYENTYKVTRELSDYEIADGTYVDGQWLLAGGVSLSAIGIYTLLRRARRKKAFERSQCAIDEHPGWSPLIGANSIGLAYRF